jgi:hypothetical protein
MHLDSKITQDEILEAMSSLKNGKAPSAVTTIPNVVRKLFHKVLANRLLQHAEDNGMLHTAQNVFRKHRSTDDHIYCISQVVRGRQRMHRATYTFFLDLRKAYDTVWQDGLLYKLWQAGVRGCLWHYIDLLYRTSHRTVRVVGHTSAVVDIDLDVSSILFNIFVNDLITAYQQACPGAALPAQDAAAVETEQGRLASQLFADDFMGLAESPMPEPHYSKASLLPVTGATSGVCRPMLALPKLLSWWSRLNMDHHWQKDL